MRKMLAMLILLAVVLNMVGCSGNEKSKNKSDEAEDPMVRLYYPTEIVTEDSCVRYEYEENWWEKAAVNVVIYQLGECWEKEILEEEMYLGHVVVSTNRFEPEPGTYGMHYYQWTTSYDIYENGRIIYSREDMGENRFGHICDIYTCQYDEYGRVAASRYQGFYEDGYGPVDGDPDGICEYIYTYVTTESGSVGTCQLEYDGYIQVYYDENYRLVRREIYEENELVCYAEYEYNSAGCEVNWALVYPESEVTSWTKNLYETVEVPLSVAEKYPMFKWEYIE